MAKTQDLTSHPAKERAKIWQEQVGKMFFQNLISLKR